MFKLLSNYFYPQSTGILTLNQEEEEKKNQTINRGQKS